LGIYRPPGLALRLSRIQLQLQASVSTQLQIILNILLFSTYSPGP
jgi:hypothetical protein